MGNRISVITWIPHNCTNEMRHKFQLSIHNISSIYICHQNKSIIIILQRNSYEVQLFKFAVRLKFAVINRKGTFAPLAPPAKGQRRQLPHLPPLFRRP